MRKAGDTLLGGAAGIFDNGGAGFFYQGVNERWRDVFRPEDLARYDAAVARLPPDCARWLAAGRAAVDPGAPARV